MSAETAERLFWAITVGMALIWLIGIRYALSRIGRPSETTEDDDRYAAYAPEEVTGEEIVTGRRDAVAKKLADRLAAGFGSQNASFLKITACSPERVAFEPMPGTPQPGLGISFQSGEMALRQQGDRVRIRYAINLQRYASIMRLVTYLVCFVYGGLFVIGAPLLIWFLVLRSNDPNLRWQVLQTFQMVHGVWPPFLVGGLYTRNRAAAGRYFQTLLANLEYT
jgi:hypothetical protein